MDAPLNLTIPEEKKRELEELAVSKGLSLSGLVRMVLYEYLKRENEGGAT